MVKKNAVKFSAKFGRLEITFLEDIIIRSFYPEGRDMTIKTIIERCGYSYERANSALKSLKEKKIVIEKKMGKTLVYSLDFHNLYSELGFSHYMLEKIIDFGKKYPKIFRAIKELEKQPFDIIILFGSYSKGTETQNSDIDLMVVTDKKNKENEVYGLKHVYNLDFAPAFVRKQEFPKIKKENNVLWNSLKKFSIVFKGVDLYYYLVYKNENS